MGSYNDGQVWVAELVGTTVFCVLGLGGIANAVLPGTKGHGIGFLGIAFCFGWGVFLALQFMGRISGTCPLHLYNSFCRIMILVASVRSVLDLSSRVLLRFCFERGFYKGEEEEDMRVFVAGGSTEFTGFYNPAVALAGAVVGDIGWTRMLVCISAEMVGGFVAAILIWFTYLPHFQPLEFVQQGEDSLCNCCDLETGGVAVIKQELSEPAHRYLLSHIFKIIFNMRPDIPVMI
jgi:glycerol uptake facilitator-like aquaporin